MGQRFSYQREQIYQAVCGTRQHPTAQMVYEGLRPALPHLSLGTVYRNLHQMAQEGRLVELDGPVSRFDAEIRPHTHFRCLACGGVSDVDALPYDEGLDRLAASGGRRVRGHSLVFTGICPACAGENNTELA